MDQNVDPSHSNREQGQPRQHRRQQTGGGPPPEVPPSRGPQGGQPPQRGPPTHQGQPPQQQGHHTGGGHSQQPPQQQPRGTSPPPQQGHQPQQGMGSQGMGGQPGPSHQQGPPPQRSPQSQQGMGGQQMGGPGAGGQQAMPPQQGMGSQGMGGQQMGGQGMGGQRQLSVEPVGAEKMSPDEVVTASRDDPLTSLIEKMDETDVGTVVITEEERPVGLVTDRKIALTLQETQDVSELTAEDVMTEDPITITQDTNFFDALRAMGGSGVRRAPIVDDEGTLVGIVSVDDAIVLLAEELNQVSDVIETQIDRL